MLSPGDIIIIVFVVVAAIGVGLYFLNKYASKKMVQQEQLINQNKMTASIYVIDKKHEKPEAVNLPKAVLDSFPKLLKLRKSYFVKAKVGAQIVTLMCDKKVYADIDAKKTIKVELAGIYIVGIKGAKPKITSINSKKKESLLDKAKSLIGKKA